MIYVVLTWMCSVRLNTGGRDEPMRAAMTTRGGTGEWGTGRHDGYVVCRCSSFCSPLFFFSLLLSLFLQTITTGGAGQVQMGQCEMTGPTRAAGRDGGRGAGGREEEVRDGRKAG